MSTVDKSSHSEVESYAACERRHFYSYGLKIQGRSTSDGLTKGNVGHAGLAMYYQSLKAGVSEDEAVDLAFEAARLEMRKYEVFDPDKLLAETLLLLGHYFDNYEGEEFKVLDVETLYNVQLTTEFTLPVKMDVILEFPYEGIIAMDHKFSGEFFSADKVDISPQLVKYWVALDAMGKRVDGIWYNEIRTRNTIANKANPSERFRRTPVELTPKRIVRTMREHMVAARRITRLKSLPLVEWEGETIRNHLHCQMCPFTTLCGTDLEGDDHDLVINNFYEPKEYK